MAAVTGNDLRAAALVENVRYLALPGDLREAWGNEPVVRIDR